MTAHAQAAVPQLRSASWLIEVKELAPGLTRVTQFGSRVHVRIGDTMGDGAAGRSPWAPRLRSLLTADLAVDGSIAIVSRCAPPALLVSSSGAHLLPTAPDERAHTSLGPKDLLVICSAGALDGSPAGLVDLLKAGPAAILDADPGMLLRDLLRGATTGAAAVVRRSTTIRAASA